MRREAKPAKAKSALTLKGLVRPVPALNVLRLK